MVGYGETSGGAIVRELRASGHEVLVTPTRACATKNEHIHATYRDLAERDLRGVDCLFMYNTHHQFAAEIRRMLYERGLTGIVLAGYTHGSHWDPSDQIRANFPLLRFADLGNVMAMDTVFLVSQYMADTMADTIGRELGLRVRAEFLQKARVVGGTIDNQRLDAARVAEDAGVTIVFNHSASPAKRPAVFFLAAREVLAARPDTRVLVTRRFAPSAPGGPELYDLRRRYPDRIVLGDTMPTDDYFAWLWRSQIQVSTAFHESFGVSTVESIYAGCCSLLPPRGCYREITGEAGLYDERRLATVLLEHAADPAARRRVAVQQREAIQRYLPARVARRIADALAEARERLRA
ncbi:hypothetical protein [Dactylosporangium sp. CA-139066]|uniref:hypothetical protein n=1 Tax=Dactylosporangium sp. CA-139066 TaxID=3239930 RepID=UPI003D8A2467